MKSLPSQSRDRKGACLEQETKIESSPSTQMARGTSLQFQRRVQEAQPRVHHGGQCVHLKQVHLKKKMKLRLLLLYVEKMFVDLSEGGR